MFKKNNSMFSTSKYGNLLTVILVIAIIAIIGIIIFIGYIKNIILKKVQKKQ